MYVSLFCRVFCGFVSIYALLFNKQSARAEEGTSEAVAGGALAPLVLPAKSLGRFLEEIDQITW